MKKFAAFILTAVMAAIMTLATLEATSVKAEATDIKVNTVAGVVDALKRGIEHVAYQDDILFISYSLQDPIPETEFWNAVEEARRFYPNEHQKWIVELEKLGMSLADEAAYCSEPYYLATVIHNPAESSVQLGIYG